MKTTFNFRKYPDVFTCEALDRQISSLRNELPLVQQKKMYGDKNRIQKFKNDKELQFAKMDCEDSLREREIREGQDLITQRFIDAEERIIGKSNRGRLVLLISGSVVGKRDEIVKVTLDPSLLRKYELDVSDVHGALRKYNNIVPAGTLVSDDANYSIKIPGLYENYREIGELPIKMNRGFILKLDDISEIKEQLNKMDERLYEMSKNR